MLEKDIQYREKDVIALVYNQYYALPFLRKRVSDMLYYFWKSKKVNRVKIITGKSFRYEYSKGI
jgi:hypothetical protein